MKYIILLFLFPLFSYSQTNTVDLLTKDYYTVFTRLDKDKTNITNLEEHTIKETTRYISYYDKLAKARIHLMFENNVSYAASCFYDSSLFNIIVAMMNKDFTQTSDLEWINYGKQNIYYKIINLGDSFMVNISKNKL